MKNLPATVGLAVSHRRLVYDVTPPPAAPSVASSFT